MDETKPLVCMIKNNCNKKNLFDNHFRAVYFRMYNLLKKNGIINNRHGLKQKHLISMFLDFTGIVVPIGFDKKTFLVKLYRSMESEYLPAPEYNFYLTKEWKEIRNKILKLYGLACMKCGKETQFPHIDHIKPKSIYPELKLHEDNLQVLCRRCNIGKSNRNEIDYRINPMGRSCCTAEMPLLN